MNTLQHVSFEVSTSVELWGSAGSDSWVYSLLGCCTVYPGTYVPTIRKNLLS